MPSNGDMNEIVSDFVTETKELLESVDTDLLELEKTPDNLDLVNKLFRAAHTIKGAAGFLGFNQIVEVVHNSENVLNKCRQGEMKVTPNINDTLFSAIDQIRSFVEDVSQGRELTDNITDLVAEIKACLDIDTDELLNEIVEEALQDNAEAPVEEVPEELEEELEAVAEETPKETKYKTSILTSFNETLTIEEQKLTDDQLKELAGIRCKKPALKAKPKSKAKDEKEPEKVEAPTENEVVVKPAVPLPKTPEPASSDRKQQTIRVDVDRLDSVLNLVGELVLGRNRIMQIGQELQSDYESDERVQTLTETMSHINMITIDLQNAVMKTRMQPIKKIFSRFPRMVRDLAKNLNKEIDIKLEGENTELDKSVIQEIGDPLVHLIRNSVDHGIEMPDVREANGKPRKGTVTLSAYHDGNHIVIEVEDDGGGIDADKVTSVALKRGIIQESDIERMTEKDKLNLIFSPGFSTVEVTTDISGRGVGMDVVRNNVVRLNGTIVIDTKLGEGTTFSVKLPLTVAIIQTLMVGVGDESFALPLVSIIKTVRTSSDNIQCIDMREVIHLRDEILPLVRMSDIFEVEPSPIEKDKNGNQWLYVVVVAIAEKKVGLVVEQLLGQEEVVIKSLGSQLQPKGIAGATILGNGRVTLIVDLGSLVELIEERGYESQTGNNTKSRPALQEKLGKGKTILIVDDSNPSRKVQKKILESGGFTVLEAKNGVEGLKILEEHRDIHLVITDIIMPNMDGIEMSRQIKSSTRHSSLPIIALTANDEKEKQIEGFKAGINEFFYKTDMSGMLTSVRRYIH